MTDKERKAALAVIWRNTHRDFKGTLEDGTKSILIYRQGTCLVPLEALTDQEIADRLPKT